MNSPIDPRVRRTRAAVIKSTLVLLGERGIAGTTIEAVSDHSGVAKTTIYRHWNGQAELVLDAFDSILQPPPDPDTGTLRGDLIALLSGLATGLSTGPASGLMFAVIDAAEREPAFARLHRREAGTRHAVILEVISRGVRRGELPTGTSPADVLDLLAGPIFYRRAVSGGDLTTDFARHVVDLVLTGYRTQQTDP